MPTSQVFVSGQEVVIISDVLETAEGKVHAEFDFTDVAGGSKYIGSVPAGKIAHSVFLGIADPFDAAITLSVGDDAAQARLMAIADNCPFSVGIYESNPNVGFSLTTGIKLFFGGGMIPTAGRGSITVYFE